jgi:ABC-type glycerol-3-phosphate transport system permease component
MVWKNFGSLRYSERRDLVARLGPTLGAMRAQTVGAIALDVLLCIAHALALFPLPWMVMASFMHAREASGYPPRWLPSLDQYRTLFSRLDLAR